ncbi:50S ribosomal protein L11 methyltransferase [Microtetraspora sp. NBRC 16547]|uniref:class I SAM-dependent methyltransferase n=1 Tax=Microtetraspora sp. NBRC 16547 TaxID=3030993 RepID=UPI0025533225|nr:50S ribosomal protein L11 methyltransferase [Microtetraspora sp. NBRC 16547]
MEHLVRAHTRLVAVPYVPEIRLHLAPAEAQDEVFGLWERTGGLPFWAYAWAGGQALARHVLDYPELVRGRTVLDLASGSGLVAIAAAMAGAAGVVANDIDPHAVAAIALNARANGAAVTVRSGDILSTTPEVDVVLAGDAFYDVALTRRVMPFLLRTRAVSAPGPGAEPEPGYGTGREATTDTGREAGTGAAPAPGTAAGAAPRAAAGGATRAAAGAAIRRLVLAADPERACSYLPRDLFAPVSVHLVPAVLEDVPYKRTTVWRLM